MKKKILSKKAIAASIKTLAKDIDTCHQCNFADAPLVLVAVMQGAIHFASDLSRALKTPHTMSFIFASSYRGEQSSGQVATHYRSSGLTAQSLRKAHVVVLDEICDTGLTLKTIKRDLSIFTKTKSQVETAVLLCKFDTKGVFTYLPTYACHYFAEGFFVGYGLDNNQAERHLPYIYVK